jgi:WD40 repeat protein
MIFKLKRLIYLSLILTLVGCTSINNPTSTNTNAATNTVVIPATRTVTSTTIFVTPTSKPLIIPTQALISTVKPSVTPTPEPVINSIPTCTGKGQIISPLTDFGITGTIVYQIDNHKGLYTIGGAPLTQGKIVDQQQDVNVYGFSPDGNWLAYAPYIDNPTQEKIIFITPKILLLSAEGEQIEQMISIDGLDEELHNRCVGCQGYHFWGTLGEWINNDLIHLYLGASNNHGPSAWMPKVFDPWSGNWQDQWYSDLPDLYTITPIQGGFHSIQLSPDLSRTLYPDEHGGIILWGNTQGTEIWSDSQFENDYGEYIEWSPDSKMVAAVNDFYPEKHRLLLITRDGEVTELVNASTPQPEFYAGSLSWSPDSRYLVFTGRIGNLDQVGEDYLYLYDTQTKSYVYRCPLPGINDFTHAGLVWSPDGQWIAYQEQPNNAMRLLNVQTGEIIEVLKNAQPVGWSDKFPVEWP